MRTRLTDAHRLQGGFTLPELLVAVTIALVVAAGALGLMGIVARGSTPVTERSAQIQQGRVMIERLTRELRQGESVLGASASGLEVLTYVHSAGCGGPPAPTAILCRVTYACGETSCTRTEREPNGDGAAAPQQVLDGITGPGVFTFAPDAVDPSRVGVRLIFPEADGGESITLGDGVSLRNWFDSEGS